MENDISVKELIRLGFKWDKEDPIQQGNSLYIELPGRIKIVFHEGNSSRCSLEQDGKLIDLPHRVIKTQLNLSFLIMGIKGAIDYSYNETK